VSPAAVTLAVLVLGSSSQAGAQDRPPVTPTRDVDVTYRAGQGDKAVEQRARFHASNQRLRLDLPTPGIYAILDYPAHTLTMVSEPKRAVLDMPAPAGAIAGVAPAGVFTRRGVDKVAGLACTDWETADSSGLPTLACFTEDGVMLRARRGDQLLVQAVRVSYGVQDAAAFTVPAGYAHTRPQAAK